MELVRLATVVLLFGCWMLNANQAICEQLSTAHNPVAVITTDLGDITVELNSRAAPKTTADFIAYAGDFFYDGLIFHRVVNGFVIQSGGYWFDLSHKNPNRDAVVNESSNGLKNRRGTIAMARDSDPDSTQAQFYLNLADNTHLDSTEHNPGYTVFGKVISGMDVADKIAEIPVRKISKSLTHMPIETVQIQRISIQLSAQQPNPPIQSEKATP